MSKKQTPDCTLDDLRKDNETQPTTYLEQFGDEHAQLDLDLYGCCDKTHFIYQQVQLAIQDLTNDQQIKMVLLWVNHHGFVEVTDDLKKLMGDLTELNKVKPVVIVIGFENETFDKELTNIMKAVTKYVVKMKGNAPTSDAEMKGTIMRMEQLAIQMGLETGVLDKAKVTDEDVNAMIVQHFNDS
jgi:hypothetical protein